MQVTVDKSKPDEELSDEIQVKRKIMYTSQKQETAIENHSSFDVDSTAEESMPLSVQLRLKDISNVYCTFTLDTSKQILPMATCESHI